MVDIGTDDQEPTPSWPTCAHRNGETGSPCIGRQVDGFDHCLAHLEPEQLAQALQQLGPEADLQAPGTDVSAELLAGILQAVASDNEPPTFGAVDLARAHFIGNVSFEGARFSGDARFDGAQFSGDARFYGAQFRLAGFGHAQFSGDAEFGGAQFSGDAWFFCQHHQESPERSRRSGTLNGMMIAGTARAERADDRRLPAARVGCRSLLHLIST
jgi:uncharacterized protein YjbI with pentapeptide repeats